METILPVLTWGSAVGIFISFAAGVFYDIRASDQNNKDRYDRYKAISVFLLIVFLLATFFCALAWVAQEHERGSKQKKTRQISQSHQEELKK